ncbi:MAG: hypothetical protein QXZ09_08415, partial [Candidatus Methanomethylicaceae archaeon]
MPIYDRWGPIEANTAAGVSSSQSSSPYDPLAGWKPPPLGKYYQPAPPLPPPSQRPYGAAYFAEPYFAASPDSCSLLLRLGVPMTSLAPH